ncbi:MAG: L,D-transpeptidase family protein [Burkholderiales bacterium]
MNPRLSLRLVLAAQKLSIIEDGRIVKEYPVSTAKNGAGEKSGSYCTPRGRHVIRAKIGAGQPVNAVFVNRRPSGEIYTPELGMRFGGRDWMLTRILWLSGCEPGFNRLGDVDTMRRFIYIHGSPDHGVMEIAGSRGCIRMRNADVMDLFDRIEPGTGLDIVEHESR